MDILYVVGTGSKWNNNELRYSLRSIEKNGINVGRVFIAGYLPDFVNEKSVIFVPVKDKTTVKHYNIIHAIDYVIQNTDIGINDNGDFLYSSDDHFYIKPTDFGNYPIYSRGKDLPDNPKNCVGHKKYYTTLISTRKLLQSYNLPYQYFSWHGNTHFNTKFWNDPIMKELVQKSYTMSEGCEPTCLMLNYQMSVEPFEFVVRADKKIKSNDNIKLFKAKIADREVFSTASIITPYLPQVLKEFFPNKSKYEK